MTLKELKVGKHARITSVGGEGALRQHFLDMGVIPGAEVEVIQYAPLGDPVELLIHGYSLTLRLDDAAKINVETIPEKGDTLRSERLNRPKKHHPGLGEGGKYHAKADENPLPRTLY